MPRILSDESLDTLFRNATAQPVWLDRPVGDTLLRALWELVKLGPVSGKSSAARLLFLRSEEAKERLAPALPPEERAALRTVPLAAILAGELGVLTGAVEAAFLSKGTAVVTFLCALGYGDETRCEPTPPRRDLDEACRIL
jgi:hypothetical protein